MEQVRAYLAHELFAIHLSLQNILSEFHAKYSKFRLIDIKHMKSIMPLTLDEFIKYINNEVYEKSKLLLSTWHQGCADIIVTHRESIENLMPSDDQVRCLSYTR